MWVPEDSAAKKNYDYIEQVFTVPSNDMAVIITAKGGEDTILTQQFLDIMWEFDDFVKGLAITYGHLWWRNRNL